MDRIEELIEIVQSLSEEDIEILLKFARILKDSSDMDKKMLLELEGHIEHADWSSIRWKDGIGKK